MDLSSIPESEGVDAFVPDLLTDNETDSDFSPTNAREARQVSKKDFEEISATEKALQTRIFELTRQLEKSHEETAAMRAAFERRSALCRKEIDTVVHEYVNTGNAGLDYSRNNAISRYVNFINTVTDGTTATEIEVRLEETAALFRRYNIDGGQGTDLTEAALSPRPAAEGVHAIISSGNNIISNSNSTQPTTAARNSMERQVLPTNAAMNVGPNDSLTIPSIREKDGDVPSSGASATGAGSFSNRPPLSPKPVSITSPSAVLSPSHSPRQSHSNGMGITSVTVVSPNTPSMASLFMNPTVLGNTLDRIVELRNDRDDLKQRLGTLHIRYKLLLEKLKSQEVAHTRITKELVHKCEAMGRKEVSLNRTITSLEARLAASVRESDALHETLARHRREANMEKALTNAQVAQLEVRLRAEMLRRDPNALSGMYAAASEVTGARSLTKAINAMPTVEYACDISLDGGHTLRNPSRELLERLVAECASGIADTYTAADSRSPFACATAAKALLERVGSMEEELALWRMIAVTTQVERNKAEVMCVELNEEMGRLQEAARDRKVELPFDMANARARAALHSLSDEKANFKEMTRTLRSESFECTKRVHRMRRELERLVVPAEVIKERDEKASAARAASMSHLYQDSSGYGNAAGSSSEEGIEYTNLGTMSEETALLEALEGDVRQALVDNIVWRKAAQRDLAIAHDQLLAERSLWVRQWHTLLDHLPPEVSSAISIEGLSGLASDSAVSTLVGVVEHARHVMLAEARSVVASAEEASRRARLMRDSSSQTEKRRRSDDGLNESDSEFDEIATTSGLQGNDSPDGSPRRRKVPKGARGKGVLDGGDDAAASLLRSDMATQTVRRWYAGNLTAQRVGSFASRGGGEEDGGGVGSFLTSVGEIDRRRSRAVGNDNNGYDSDEYDIKDAATSPRALDTRSVYTQSQVTVADAAIATTTCGGELPSQDRGQQTDGVAHQTVSVDTDDLGQSPKDSPCVVEVAVQCTTPRQASQTVQTDAKETVSRASGEDRTIGEQDALQFLYGGPRYTHTSIHTIGTTSKTDGTLKEDEPSDYIGSKSLEVEKAGLGISIPQIETSSRGHKQDEAESSTVNGSLRLLVTDKDKKEVFTQTVLLLDLDDWWGAGGAADDGDSLCFTDAGTAEGDHEGGVIVPCANASSDVASPKGMATGQSVGRKGSGAANTSIDRGRANKNGTAKAAKATKKRNSALMEERKPTVYANSGDREVSGSARHSPRYLAASPNVFMFDCYHGSSPRPSRDVEAQVFIREPRRHYEVSVQSEPLQTLDKGMQTAEEIRLPQPTEETEQANERAPPIPIIVPNREAANKTYTTDKPLSARSLSGKGTTAEAEKKTKAYADEDGYAEPVETLTEEYFGEEGHSCEASGFFSARTEGGESSSNSAALGTVRGQSRPPLPLPQQRLAPSRSGYNTFVPLQSSTGDVGCGNRTSSPRLNAPDQTDASVGPGLFWKVAHKCVGTDLDHRTLRDLNITDVARTMMMGVRVPVPQSTRYEQLDPRTLNSGGNPQIYNNEGHFIGNPNLHPSHKRLPRPLTRGGDAQSLSRNANINTSSVSPSSAPMNTNPSVSAVIRILEPLGVYGAGGGVRGATAPFSGNIRRPPSADSSGVNRITTQSVTPGPGMRKGALPSLSPEEEMRAQMLARSQSPPFPMFHHNASSAAAAAHANSLNQARRR